MLSCEVTMLSDRIQHLEKEKQKCISESEGLEIVKTDHERKVITLKGKLKEYKDKL